MVRRSIPKTGLQAMKASRSTTMLGNSENESFWEALVLCFAVLSGIMQTDPKKWKSLQRHLSGPRTVQAKKLASGTGFRYGQKITSLVYAAVNSWLSQDDKQLVIFRYVYPRPTIAFKPEPDQYRSQTVAIVIFEHDNGRITYCPIKNISSFLSLAFFCLHCDQRNSQWRFHKCEFTCTQCCGWLKCKTSDDGIIECGECNLSFGSSSCFERHRRVCDKRKLCKECDSIYIFKKPPHQHICKDKWTPMLGIFGGLMETSQVME